MKQSVKTARGLMAIAAVVASAGVSFGQADIVLSDSTGTLNYGQLNSIYSFSIGTNTCNIGNQNLNWTNNDTPAVAMNMYRLTNGRLTQVGMSWIKTACCAAAGNGCNLSCNGVGGSQLGAGCLDVYSASWNGSQSRMATRSGTNPYARTISPATSASGDSNFRRLQVPSAQWQTTSASNMYFIEGVYVCEQETYGTSLNNASYRRITNNGGLAASPAVVDTMRQGIPAIRAWRDHGLGPNQPDNRVVINTLDVPNEGRYWTAYKVTDLGNGRFLYDYAIFNLNSHVGANRLTITIPPGTNISNAGFKDVDYHSGEPYSNTDWTITVNSNSVVWQGGDFASSANGNALRWGTMYNFWFEADRPPADSQAALGMFRPHTPGAVSFAVLGPSVPPSPCNYDYNQDENVDLTDAQNMAAVAAGTLTPGVRWLDGDMNGDENADLTDAQILAQFVATGVCPL